MTDSSHNVIVGESNKLEGKSNFFTWQFKMRAILCRENIWDITETSTNPA
jgi:hypothetical protein